MNPNFTLKFITVCPLNVVKIVADVPISHIYMLFGIPSQENRRPRVLIRTEGVINSMEGLALSQGVRPKRNLKAAGLRQDKIVERVNEVTSPLCAREQLLES